MDDISAFQSKYNLRRRIKNLEGDFYSLGKIMKNDEAVQFYIKNNDIDLEGEDPRFEDV